jgi:hypothetical protein
MRPVLGQTHEIGKWVEASRRVGGSHPPALLGDSHDGGVCHGVARAANHFFMR